MQSSVNRKQVEAVFDFFEQTQDAIRVGQQLNRADFETDISLIDLGSHQQRHVQQVRFNFHGFQMQSERSDGSKMLCKSAREQWQQREEALKII